MFLEEDCQPLIEASWHLESESCFKYCIAKKIFLCFAQWGSKIGFHLERMMDGMKSRQYTFFFPIRIQNNLYSIDRKDLATHSLKSAAHPTSSHKFKIHISKNSRIAQDLLPKSIVNKFYQVHTLSLSFVCPYSWKLSSNHISQKHVLELVSNLRRNSDALDFFFGCCELPHM